jgi:cobalt-precorrin 5A hydrolase
MDLDQTVIVAGIGCRSGATVEQVNAALEAALERNETGGLNVTLIATAEAKSREPGIVAAAAARGVALAVITQTDLEAANRRTLTCSEHSMTAMNVHSVAEAAALAGAGAESQLLGPRIVVGPVTCALAARAPERASR